MHVTSYSLPWASITTAFVAPLNGEKLLIQVPSEDVKIPVLLAKSAPSLSNVFRANTDFAAFLIQEGWEKRCVEYPNDRKIRKSNTLLCVCFIVFVLIILLHFEWLL